MKKILLLLLVCSTAAAQPKQFIQWFKLPGYDSVYASNPKYIPVVPRLKFADGTSMATASTSGTVDTTVSGKYDSREMIRLAYLPLKSIWGILDTLLIPANSMIRVDSALFLIKMSGVMRDTMALGIRKKDTTAAFAGSYVTQSQRAADSTYRTAQDALRALIVNVLKNADSTTLKNTILGLVAKGISDSLAAFYSAHGITTDSLGHNLAYWQQGGTLGHVLWEGMIDFQYPDSTMMIAADTNWYSVGSFAVIIDSISRSADFGGVAVNLTPKYLYRASPLAAITAIVTSPAAITSSNGKSYDSTIAAATIPANGEVGVTFTAAVTKPKKLCIGIKWHRSI